MCAASLAVLAGGCASNVTLDPVTIPQPLLEPMAMSVALRIPANFEHFVHEEEVLGREQWTIDLGRSNAALFTQLFGFMFENVTVIGPNDDASALAIDALLEPTIDAFEFSVPSQSRTDSYAVWIRYRIKVYNRAGREVANWPVAAYGKSEQTGMTGVEPLKRAAILAMRDAAALMIMKLDTATGLSDLRDAPIAEPDETVAEESGGAEPAKPAAAPARRKFTLPPPGPVGGPAEISLDPAEDGALASPEEDKDD